MVLGSVAQDQFCTYFQASSSWWIRTFDEISSSILDRNTSCDRLSDECKVSDGKEFHDWKGFVVSLAITFDVFFPYLVEERNWTPCYNQFGPTEQGNAICQAMGNKNPTDLSIRLPPPLTRIANYNRSSNRLIGPTAFGLGIISLIILQ